MRIFFLTLLLFAATFFAALYVPGVDVNDFTVAIVVAIVISMLNTLLRPLLLTVTFPFTFFGFALIFFAINILLVKMTAAFIDGFNLAGWLAAASISLVVTIVYLVFDRLIARA